MTAACGEPDTWIDPRTGETLAPGPLMASLARRRVILLGEHHDNAEHHRWQLDTLNSLHARRRDMIVGFEMFPRRVQNVLDSWAAGTLDERSFLDQSDWESVWGYDADLYLPLFRFVRQKRLGMIALNTDRSLVRRVGKEGWAAIPRDQRGGLTDPAAASDAYRRYLADVYIDGHGLAAPSGSAGKDTPGGRENVASVLDSDGFRRFVAAQLTWDRAMAEALAAAHAKRPGALIVGIVGEGHAKFGHGVPHQLADLGIADTAILLPVSPDETCQGLPAAIADAVFVTAPRPPKQPTPPKPRLGIAIRPANGGVRIIHVVKGSVAEATGLAAGDIVLTAAGQPVTKMSQLIAIIGGQAPGARLPLRIRRDGKELDLVAKFPPEPGKPG